MRAILSGTLFMLIMSGCFKVTAQTFQGEHDVSLSYGFVSGRQIVDNQSQDDDGGGTYESAHTGNIFITYHYFIRRRIALGIAVGSQTIWGSNYGNYSYHALENNYKLTNNEIAGEVVYLYSKNQLCQFYMLFGSGINIYKRTDHPVSSYYTPAATTGINYNLQYDPIALRVGRKLSGFIELGIGYKGLLNTGVTYVFGKRPLKDNYNNQSTPVYPSN